MINKKGFTLSELLMVIAIIVILSGATMIGVVSTINKTRENAAKLEENNGDNFESEAMVAVESAKGTVPSHVVNQEKVDTPEPTKAPDPTKAPTTAPSTTPDPTPVPTTPPETTKTQGGGGNSNTANFGTATSGFTGYYNNGQPGLMSLTASGSDAITIRVTDGWDNHNPDNDTVTVTIKKKDGKYYMTVNSGNGWVATQVTGYKYQGEYQLSSSDISNLQSKLGLKLN
ncbi:MAG: type II secretion system protein [Oscillospiraceae bacterium]|nr:type II secretion system protein [Oscillospiraceae bacterium]